MCICPCMHTSFPMQTPKRCSWEFECLLWKVVLEGSFLKYRFPCRRPRGAHGNFIGSRRMVVEKRAYIEKEDINVRHTHFLFTHLSIYLSINIYIYIYVYIYIYIHMYVYQRILSTYICVDWYLCICIYIYIYICMFINEFCLHTYV
jgi:hypothetical protein